MEGRRREWLDNSHGGIGEVLRVIHFILTFENGTDIFSLGYTALHFTSLQALIVKT